MRRVPAARAAAVGPPARGRPGHPVRTRTAHRYAAVLAAGLLVPLPLAGCSSDQGRTDSAAPARDPGEIRTTDRQQISTGGTLRWAVDAAPGTLNVFQPDADEASRRVAGATLPTLFTLDAQGEPKPDEDYLRGAEVTSTEPRQTVVYKLAPKARWNDGRRISAADFRAQWKALRGKNDAYWTARNAGYDRIRTVRKGEGPGEVEVVFNKPYADWRSLFAPLYPKQTMGNPSAFNDGARKKLPASAGPFRVARAGGKGKTVLERDPRWWGSRPKLERIELKPVPQGKRAKALREGEVDLARIDARTAEKIESAGSLGGPGHPHRKGEHGEQGEHTDHDTAAAGARRAAKLPKGVRALRKYEVRKAMEPAYTQLALNGASGPLSDERVRRAVARALDRDELASEALHGTGLPDEPLGNHLRMANQDGYKDNSKAVGGKDLDSAQSLLAEAGWETGGGILRGAGRGHGKSGGDGAEGADGPENGAGKSGGKQGQGGPAEPPSGAGKGNVSGVPRFRAEAQAAAVALSPRQLEQVVDRPLSLTTSTTVQRGALLAQAAQARLAAAEESGGKRALSRARSAQTVARDVRAQGREMRLLSTGRAAAVRTKEGKPLALRFVLPDGDNSRRIRATGKRIAGMLNEVGIRTQIKKVPDESYFKDHIAAGEYDLALYSWPASAYPATDARPIYAKPQPAPDGSLLVEQNYTRVGTDKIDQLFERAAGELDEGRRRELMQKADARIWAVAGSLPLHQNGQLVAADRRLVNAGAFGFADPQYEDIGFTRH
ncbi:ABC transporter family substrate-binding protein [Streptomyces sp. NRRL S-1868]|uniref:ABC transporter family substrate-binding protein n=1 Tax=Streptomyces sp. NRRL S-1868 TaxID=1463892 RepID=UPI00099CA4EF|nr:ABC transporter family substrate-binding protein [Streptomyces sp. NRRL S-1868]